MTVAPGKEENGFFIVWAESAQSAPRIARNRGDLFAQPMPTPTGPPEGDKVTKSSSFGK